MGRYDLFVAVEEFERIVPACSCQSVCIRLVFKVDIHRSGPVFRRLCRLQSYRIPRFELQTFDGAIEMLQLYRVSFLVYRDDFEQIAVQSPIPVPHFRVNYPTFLVNPASQLNSFAMSRETISL